MKKKITFYITVFALFLVFKVAYTYATTNDLIFLLKPTSKLVSIVTNNNSTYSINSGFYHQNLNILIDKSCSGFNFWMLCFLMLSFLCLKYASTTTFKILTIPIILVISYGITLFVNASRILFSILIENHLKTSSMEKIANTHQLEGIFIYLSYLILVYLGFEYLLKKTHYEKLT